VFVKSQLIRTSVPLETDGGVPSAYPSQIAAVRKLEDGPGDIVGG
jgi:hypothetical protein